MICLAYLSSATHLMDADELGAVLEVSRRNNQARELTGLLCHYDGSFLQFLEGAEDQVQAVFNTIARDPRHHQIIQIQRRPIRSRIFSDWSMGVVRPDDVSPAQQAFCQGLRTIQISGDADHAGDLDSFLTAFRTWLR
jgi:hypothetical protein